MAGIVGGAGGSVFAARPAAAAGWSPRKLRSVDVRVGDVLVGPEGSAVRIGEWTELSNGRIRLRYSSPYFGGGLLPFPGDLDEKGFTRRRTFLVLQRWTAAIALRYPAPEAEPEPEPEPQPEPTQEPEEPKTEEPKQEETQNDTPSNNGQNNGNGSGTGRTRTTGNNGQVQQVEAAAGTTDEVQTVAQNQTAEAESGLSQFAKLFIILTLAGAGFGLITYLRQRKHS